MIQVARQLYDIFNAVFRQVAAELDRSETARCLIERSSAAGVADDRGMTALVLMITKMPSVVRFWLLFSFLSFPTSPTFLTYNNACFP